MKWLIKIETIAGEILDAFTFSGTSENGVARAKTEAGSLGIQFTRVWAERV